MINFRGVNKAEVASFFEISMPTLDVWIRRGCPVIERGTGKGIPWIIDILAVAEWLYGRNQHHQNISPDDMTPTDRKK